MVSRIFSRRWILSAGMTVATLAVVGLLTALALSPLPMRGAGLFGALAKKIKGNPGATIMLSLGGVAALWLGLGVLAAGQEWTARKRRST